MYAFLELTNPTVTLNLTLTSSSSTPAPHLLGISDGTEHAVQEMAHTLMALHEQGRSEEAMLAFGEFCCIHGKALEENNGMEAAFPGGYVMDACRLSLMGDSYM